MFTPTVLRSIPRGSKRTDNAKDAIFCMTFLTATWCNTHFNCTSQYVGQFTLCHNILWLQNSSTTQNLKHVLRIFQTTQDLELLMCSQQPVTGPYPGPRVLSLHFSDRNFVWILSVPMWSEVTPRWQHSVLSCTNTKWGSLFLLQNSKPGHVQIVPL